MSEEKDTFTDLSTKLWDYVANTEHGERGAKERKQEFGKMLYEALCGEWMAGWEKGFDEAKEWE